MSPTCRKNWSSCQQSEVSEELNAMANRYFKFVKYAEKLEEYAKKLKFGGRGPHCWKYVATDCEMSNKRKKQHKNILGNSENILSTSQNILRPLVPRGSSVSFDPEEKMLEEKVAVCAYYYSLLCEKDISEYSSQQLAEELDAFNNHYIKLVKYVEKLEKSMVKHAEKLEESKIGGRGHHCDVFKYVATDYEISEQEAQQKIDWANGRECSTSMTTGSGRGGGSELLEMALSLLEVDEDQQLTIKGTKLTLMGRFKRTGDQRMAAFEEMLRHRLLLNFMDDEGHDGQLLEEDQEEK
uniref:Uncharacterized protein n=1 Tax=Meloidogyne javanica TaxID=6303 RepID=A0A915N5W1_MELJA